VDPGQVVAADRRQQRFAIASGIDQPARLRREVRRGYTPLPVVRSRVIALVPLPLVPVTVML
jgi:hypothetical protein